MKTIKIILVLISLSFSGQSNAQEKANDLSKNEVRSIIREAQNLLKEFYIDLNSANDMTNTLNTNLKSGVYYNISDPELLAETITKDLRSISHDLHLKVSFEPKRIAKMKMIKSDADNIKQMKKQIQGMKRSNFGFTEAKILDGNIGYLDIKYFADSKYAKEPLESAMQFLSNTNALIIDLRDNQGGLPSTVKLLSGYFFNEDQKLLNTFYNRSTNTSEEFRANIISKEKQRLKIPIYVLTSSKTFSAAEAFAYNLKHLDRAIIVGETTKGGANRTKRITLSTEFTISVPYIEAIHPVTKSNWEAKGIHPDIKSSAQDAFVTAYTDAIDKMLGNHPMKNKLFNKIGYSFLNKKNITDAIKVFKLNTELHPTDANVWDSLGEAYFSNGEKEKSLIAYKKALELDACLKSTKSMVETLETNN